MLSAPSLTKREIKERFEDGSLPLSFSQTPLWASVLSKLDRLQPKIERQHSAIAEEQRKLEVASRETQNALRMIQELSEKVSHFEEAERVHAAAVQTLRDELQEWQELDIDSLKVFAQSAADVEKKLVTQLEDQLLNDKDGLFALTDESEEPKLSLLLNCFGARKDSIQALKDVSSVDLAMISVGELKELMANLPRDQQNVILYTQERLLYGAFPFAEHDCALCDCESAEDMAAFLQELGLRHITVDLVQQTGSFGRGALLFLTTQELRLETTAQKTLLNKARMEHRRK